MRREESCVGRQCRYDSRNDYRLKNDGLSKNVQRMTDNQAGNIHEFVSHGANVQRPKLWTQARQVGLVYSAAAATTVILISKLLVRNSKAKRLAPAYSRALHQIRVVVQKVVHGRFRPGYQRIWGGRVAVIKMRVQVRRRVRR